MTEFAIMFFIYFLVFGSWYFVIRESWASQPKRILERSGRVYIVVFFATVGMLHCLMLVVQKFRPAFSLVSEIKDFALPACLILMFYFLNRYADKKHAGS